jgi:aryl-alcohol dehydrogenase-like predicted oxidoreductase
MTFGTEWGWGTDLETARRLFRRYIEAGGNFIDTAEGYTNGRSEEILGNLVREAGNRDRLVLASKFSFNPFPGDPNAGGNSRKNIHRALEGSLRRLKTDFLDLYWLQSWDGSTPAEEVVSTLDGLVSQGKVRYIGLSGTPAWYAARYQTLAELRGLERACALQLEYSLIERTPEREHISAAMELGLGLCASSPLAGGFLSGKYSRSRDGADGIGRLQVMRGSGNPVFEKLTERNWRILDVLLEVARELGRPAAQVAINWVAKRPGVTCTMLGATKLAQLEETLSSLDLVIPPALSRKLEAVSRPEPASPYVFFRPAAQSSIRTAVSFRPELDWYRRAAQ